MQRTLSQEYICQHAQEKSLGEFFNTNNYSQYAPQAKVLFQTTVHRSRRKLLLQLIKRSP